MRRVSQVYVSRVEAILSMATDLVNEAKSGRRGSVDALLNDLDYEVNALLESKIKLIVKRRKPHGTKRFTR